MKRSRRRILTTLSGIPGVLVLGAAGILTLQLRQENLDRALIAAVKRHDTPALTVFLRSGANPNAEDRPLVHRSFLDAIEAVFRGDDRRWAAGSHDSALLLAAGCSNDSIDFQNASCSDPDNYEMVRALVERGANVNCQSQFGSTPLLEALRGNHARVAVLLINKGADVNASCGFGLFERNLWQSGHRIISESPELLRTAISHGAHVNTRFDTDPGSEWDEVCTPLFAMMQNHAGKDADTDAVADNVRALLEAGANPNTVSNRSDTPLMWAMLVAGPKVGRVLLDHGARINLMTKRNGTALHHARVTLQYENDPQRAQELKTYIAFLMRNGAVDRSGP